MSPVSFGPSDVKNPNNLQWAHVPESYWLTKALLLDFDWVIRDAANPFFTRTDYPHDNPLEALKQCFQTLRKYEIRLSLTSNRRQARVVSELGRLHLAEDFDNIRCFEDVREVKPSSEMHLLSMEVLGLKPGRTVAFETSAEGARAAKKAGIFCVTPPQLDGDADFILGSLLEAPLLHILERIDRAKRSGFSKPA